MNKLKIDITEYFKDLTFVEETHKYSVKGKPLAISVSGLIHKFVHKTDWDAVLTKTAKAKGVSKESLSAEWKNTADIACDLGTDTHLFGEIYPIEKDATKANTMHKKAVVKFWNDLPEFVVPLFLELKMYHKEYLFAGTADIILYNKKTNQIIIGDYKTNKDLFKNFNKNKMQAPFNNLLCCPFNHYQLQLSFYQILLEQFLEGTGIKVVGRKLIYLKADGNYELYDLNDYTEILKKELVTLDIC